MAKNFGFEASMRKFRDSLRNIAKREIEFAGKSIQKNVCEAIQRLAQDRLLEYNEASAESENLITDIAFENIYIDEPTGEVRVTSDAEGLVLFLEYGTGLTGRENNTSDGLADANRVGWNYALHANRYKKLRNGRQGWFFENKNEHYVDKNDWIPPEESTVKSTYRQRVRFYIRQRNGRTEYVKSYARKRPHGPKIRSTKNLVFSSGIKPIRYMYEAKKKVKEFIALERGSSLTYKQFIENLDYLE